MQSITKFLIITSALGLIVLINISCIWDKDTIEMERQRFPNALELMLEGFVRYSSRVLQMVNQRL